MCMCMCDCATLLYSRKLTDHCKSAIMEKTKIITIFFFLKKGIQCISMHGTITSVWAHGNHSFDRHLSYLGLVSCSFSSQVSSGARLGAAAVAEGLAGGQTICLHPKFPQGLSLGAAPQWLDGCNILCLPIQQTPFFIRDNMIGNGIQRMEIYMTIMFKRYRTGKQTDLGAFKGQQMNQSLIH